MVERSDDFIAKCAGDNIPHINIVGHSGWSSMSPTSTQCNFIFRPISAESSSRAIGSHATAPITVNS